MEIIFVTLVQSQRMLVYGSFLITKLQTKVEKNSLTKPYMFYHQGPTSSLFDGNNLSVSFYMVIFLQQRWVHFRSDAS